MHTTPAQQPAQPLPLISIPFSYRDAKGHCDAHARSPWNPTRWIVYRWGQRTDLECVHDDFGNLVPMRERLLCDDWTQSASWKPVAREVQ